MIKMLQGTCGKQESIKILNKRRNFSDTTKSLWVVEKEGEEDHLPNHLQNLVLSLVPHSMPIPFANSFLS